jgi:hypothetical protein
MRGIVVIIVAMIRYLWLCFFCVGTLFNAQAQLTHQQVYVDYDAAWTYKNLKLIPVRPKGLPGAQAGLEALKGAVSMEEAMRQGLISVQERGTASTENVHWLSVYNHSNRPILFRSGELLEGGRQDRMVTKDTVMMPGISRIDLPVMCVEEGRWSEKTKKFLYKGMANPGLRKVLDQSNNQVLIWREINSQLQADSISSKTLSYLAKQNTKSYSAEAASYKKYFSEQWALSDSNLVGMICLSGDQILGADLFTQPDLFFAAADALLLGYSEAAIARGSTPKVPDATVRAYLDPYFRDEGSQQQALRKSGKAHYFRGKIMHLAIY